MSRNMKVGIDNYGLLPLGLTPMEVLVWAKEHNADGVQFSGLTTAESKKLDQAHLQDLRKFAAAHDLYLEWGGGQHIPLDMTSWKKKDIMPGNRQAAEAAAVLGTRIVRSCSGGLMRWDRKSPTTDEFLQVMAQALRSHKDMLCDLNVVLALETHFEFTTFELLRLFDMCGALPGEYLGICLDTMNLLTMLEDPLAATQRVLPWVVSTHIKDGGILFSEQGFITFPTRIGRGIIDLAQIIRLLNTQQHRINLSIEDHGGSFSLPVYESDFLAEFPDLSLPEFIELSRLAGLAQDKFHSAAAAITPRSDWPDICAERMAANISALKNIVNEES